MARRITRDNLGAWLLRCNPRSEPELPAMIAQGGHRIRQWCVADNYRSRLLVAGDPVVLWVSGDGRQLTRGIWGMGWVIAVNGFPRPDDSVETAEDGTDQRRRPRADVDIPLSTEAVSDHAIRAAGIDDLEVQVQPQGANPSWISAAQYARLAVGFPSLANVRSDTWRPGWGSAE